MQVAHEYLESVGSWSLRVTLTESSWLPEGSADAKALDYSLKRWVALTRYLDDGAVPIDNNPVENTIRPWALGRLLVVRRIAVQW
ncbi:hypothetical protein PSCICM_50300 [Pseudomonas cichorii]|mgnify:CR=1 FL=1|nr:hypothetical protein PSCICM_50300 [Pseudomonas cichorii]